ncbi:hypothetical protein N657DRAFT_681582 [Parathielavia appendiculata]|uniref:Uncharacterized protein n=1 Tax=Parathielavia appendiculata TaxID=2587402 RepID=A0AAN6TXH0_9PEZI|nr:hypothetical protein N657DRAFT_681582 [Parathielavia appendiculata]
MAPGMAHTPSQPGATPGGIPHQLVGHMGVSGPSPQISAATLMGGVPPGNPNAHAMQHLSPAQAQMFHHPQMAQMYSNNPALQQQMQQQHRLQVLQHQQQARQALMAQHNMYQNIGGVGNGQMGVPIGQMNPQQAVHMAALRRAMPVSSPLHLQPAQIAHQQQGQPMNTHMMAQHIALQQQQQIQMGQQAGNPNQHPMNPPHINLQQAQMAALQAQQQAQQAQQAQQSQQAHQQAAQQAAQAAQAQQQGPGQAQQPQPQQPQPPPGQPQQAQPQGPQPGHPGGPGANGPAPTQGPPPGQTPQPNTQQQPQAPPQTPQTTQAQNQAQLVAQLHAQAQQQQQQQQAHAAGFALAQQSLMQQRRELKGMYLLRLMQFNEHLSGFPGSRGRDDLDYWNNFVRQFFSQKGVLKHAILIKENDEQNQQKHYEIAYPAIARYFHTHFDSGVKTMQLIMNKGTTEKTMPNDCHMVINDQASLVYWFEGGSHLVAQGCLRVHFDHDQKFDIFEFETTHHEEYISRQLVIQAARPAHNWVKEWRALNQQDPKQSPEISKKSKPKPAKVPAGAPPDLELPHSFVKSTMGITEAVYQFLEMVEIMGQMNPLFNYYHAHPGLAPYAALDQYVNQINAASQGMNGQPMPQAGGPRTPGFGQFQVGASPAMPNSMLPGSPHVVGSPVPGQMAAPVMQLQASQQGTNSSGPSANTSPAQNSNNKRRRASAVKTEEDNNNTPGAASAPTPQAPMGTPQLNGTQIKGKQPPTPRMPKRLKTGGN